MLAKTGVQHCSGNTIELITAGRNFSRVHTLAIIDSGDSDIIRRMSEQTSENQTRKVFSLIKLQQSPF